MKKYLLIISTLSTFFLSTLAVAGNMYLGPTLFVVDNQASNSSFRGVYPRLMFGYSDVFEDLYIAAEAFVVGSTFTLDDNTPNSHYSTKTTQSYGLAIIPGFSINNTTMGFFRLGVITSKFSGPSVYGSGVQWGAGIETVLTPYWDVRAEYNYTTYRTVSNLGAVKSDQVGLGLVYKVI